MGSALRGYKMSPFEPHLAKFGLQRDGLDSPFEPETKIDAQFPAPKSLSSYINHVYKEKSR
jgi:hypothetical protein